MNYTDYAGYREYAHLKNPRILEVRSFLEMFSLDVSSKAHWPTCTNTLRGGRGFPRWQRTDHSTSSTIPTHYNVASSDRAQAPMHTASPTSSHNPRPMPQWHPKSFLRAQRSPRRGMSPRRPP